MLMSSKDDGSLLTLTIEYWNAIDAHQLELSKLWCRTPYCKYVSTIQYTGKDCLSPAEEVISKIERNPVVESTEVALAPKGRSEAVTESSEASPFVEAFSNESTESTEDDTLGDQESVDDPHEIMFRSS
ncbi:hypothetical protein CQW23_14463 [Capsicum baccatum]|uniref:Uncharacterized protein n=1 Tax=Capsicum baccatum TaxID=33114 RepID=A0A2G2WJ86_CAPBA|nr:hypothetical protein CQW23_14463 [Capsicum baccatum]